MHQGWASRNWEQRSVSPTPMEVLKWTGANSLDRLDTVLLEGARGIISANLCLWTQCIGASMALRTVATGPRNPFHAHAVSDLDCRCFAAGAQLDHFAHSFMATNLAWLGGIGKGRPGVLHNAQVGMADAGVCP